jgi:RNA recognition motif. (a.k.a. RRM, RBD, or RNP domain)
MSLWNMLNAGLLALTAKSYESIVGDEDGIRKAVDYLVSKAMLKDSSKRQLVGNPAAIVPPAWRQNQQRTEDPGSKIIISKLPVDVGEAEIEVRVGLHPFDPLSHTYQELFKKTVGPLKDSFIVHNSQGRSKGIAIVSFLRSGDAAVARQKYNGHFFKFA